MTSLQLVVDSHTLEKLLTLSVVSFLLSMLLTPLYTTLAYKGKWWKKPRTHAITGEAATVYHKLHAEKHDRHIPTMAGIIFVVATAAVTLAANLSRSDTWLPLAAMTGAGIIGLLDDIINIRGFNSAVAGMRAIVKGSLLVGISLVCGWWLYSKLGISDVRVPFAGLYHIGWLIIPLFIIVIFASANAVNFTDGLDGLAGGLAAYAFAAYALIALIEHKFGLAGFCMTIIGALLSYTWFNIFPARFFMGDVGSFALGTALGVVAFLTNTIFILPLIALVFLVEFLSVVLQVLSKRLRNGKKIFLSSPIHHHFEALGWPETKVTMRFWVIGQLTAILGDIIFILGGT